MNKFTEAAAARAATQERNIQQQIDKATIRYIFAPFAEMLCEPLSMSVPRGQIVPISVQGQPVGEVYLATLTENAGDMAKYNVRNGIGEIEISPAVLVDGMLSRYKDQGAIQIKALFGLPVDLFVDGRVNEEIFGDGEYPTAESYLERFNEVRGQFASDSSTFGQKMIGTLQELTESVNLAWAWTRVEAENANVGITNGDLKKFSEYHRNCFRFSGVTPRDEALNRVATDQASLGQALPEVVREVGRVAQANQPDWEAFGRGLASGMKEELVPAIVAAVKPDAEKPAAQRKPQQSTK